MDVREKLVDMLTDNLPRCGNLPRWDNPLQLSCDEQVQRIADHLIMNGVTVQEWIPVDDRLPESFESVLVFRDGKITIDHHEENGWFAHDFNGKRATHWMTIPRPPKGGGNEV